VQTKAKLPDRSKLLRIINIDVADEPRLRSTEYTYCMMKSAHHNPTFCSRYKQKATSVGKQVNDIARRHSERFRFACGTAIHALVYARTGSDKQGIAQGNAAGYLTALRAHGLPLLGAEGMGHNAETDLECQALKTGPYEKMELLLGWKQCSHDSGDYFGLAVIRNLPFACPPAQDKPFKGGYTKGKTKIMGLFFWGK
jgi:hypothetical protein